MNPQSQDPDPRDTAGVDASGAQQTGDTPPAEGSMSESGPADTNNPTRGWAGGPLTALFVTVALVVGFFVCYAVWIIANGGPG
ncbi:DUF6480 family protein [Streptomyces lonarensis]|uniref:Uncharacterized protein n=1 Tax=Streptomyces lonarensis TaxID=700599 RepID=A0A7X6D4H2_9ACTN|nr:DUF6480 family protein [Streptomyces lonarensis]NJQ07915.1 hypothetical protein [Streptomyces lonarensis]